MVPSPLTSERPKNTSISTSEKSTLSEVSIFLFSFVNLETFDIWDTDYNSDNWEPEFMTIFVTSQLIVILDSIRNSCDVLKSIFSLLQLIPYLIIGHCAIVICQLHRNISVFTLLNIQIHTADCKLSHLWMLCETNLDRIFYINQLISQRHRSQNIVVAPLHKKTMIL